MLAITNPTDKDFNSFLRAKGFSKDVQGGRINNFLIFSIYELRFTYGINNKRRFQCFAIAKNFIVTVDEE